MPEQARRELLNDLRSLGLAEGVSKPKEKLVPIEKSLSYMEMKGVMLKEMFSLCRDEGIVHRRNFCYIVEKLGEAVHSPFPQAGLFVEIFQLVMTCGLCPEIEGRQRQVIRDLLSATVMTDLISEMDEENAHQFRVDVKRLALLA